MAVDAFLKFDGLGGDGQKVGGDFDRLGDGFSDLGGAFVKLVGDLTSTDVKISPADLADQVTHDISAVGGEFSKVGQDFVKLADPLNTFDDAVVKFVDHSFKLGGAPFPLAADFLQFETDTKQTGLDFLTAGADISGTPTSILSFAFFKIATDFQNQSADALNIKGDIADFLDLKGISDSSELGMAFLKYSADWQNISDAYLKLSADFQQISSDFVPAGGKGHGAPVTFEQGVLNHPNDFLQLSLDLKVADAALGGLGGDFHKLADAIQSGGQGNTPTFKMS